MPSVFDGKMRQVVFAKQKFTDEFEPVGGLFYGQCAEYCGNSHAYMSFRALAQTDEDFDAWVNRFQNSQNPNLQPVAYNPELEYNKGSIVTFVDKSLGENTVREYRSTQKSPRVRLPIFPKSHGKKHIRMTTKLESNFFFPPMCPMSRCQPNWYWSEGSQPHPVWLAHFIGGRMDEK